MRQISIAVLAVSAIALSSAAMAADLIIETPVEPGVIDVSGNWDGAFIGVFGGYAAGELTSDETAVDGIELSGWMLGVTAGYNFTVTDGIVAGVVADIAWNDIGADDLDYTSGWNGSVRGRLGFDGGAFLPYLTAGVAFANGSFGDIENTHFGWTAGAGVEFAVAENISLDLQYRFTDYAAEAYVVEAGAFTHAVTAGINFGF